MGPTKMKKLLLLSILTITLAYVGIQSVGFMRNNITRSKKTVVNTDTDESRHTPSSTRDAQAVASRDINNVDTAVGQMPASKIRSESIEETESDAESTALESIVDENTEKLIDKPNVRGTTNSNGKDATGQARPIEVADASSDILRQTNLIYDKKSNRRTLDENVPSRSTGVDKAVDEPVYKISHRKADAFNRDYNSSIYAKDGLYAISKEKLRKMPNATKELVRSAQELFAKVPVKFLDDFKNPCWVRGDNEINCLPYFYIIGMYKCATTDVWDKIVRHPDVARVGKEPHWWGPRRHGFTAPHPCDEAVIQARNITNSIDDSPLEWYLNFYKSKGIPELLANRKTDEKGRPYYPMVFGDASISTAFAIGQEWTDLYPDLEEPPYTNADLIRALQPEAKIIMMVRNPTKRAISWWWYAHGPQSHVIPYTPESLHNEVIKFISCFKDCRVNHTLRYCAYAAGCPYKLIPNIQVSLYDVYLRDWFNAFSRDKVLVVRMEDWVTNQREVYRDILRFLDLRPLSETEANKALGSVVKNRNKKPHDDHWPETETLLNDFYRSHNVDLVKLMQDPKFAYLD